MKIRGIFAAVTVAAGVALAAGGTALASVSPTVEYTAKTASTAVAGIFAHAPSSSVNFTHVTAYVGNDGGSSQEQLQPVTTFTPANQSGGTVSGVVNGVGLGLCNQGFGPFNGYADQIGQVYVGRGLVDIVWAGGVADTTLVTPLQGTVPLPDVKSSPDLLATVAHLKLNGNVTGGHEIFGPAWGNSVGWNSFYVAATKNGGPPSQGNALYEAPGAVVSDHIRIYVGQPVG